MTEQGSLTPRQSATASDAGSVYLSAGGGSFTSSLHTEYFGAQTDGSDDSIPSDVEDAVDPAAWSTSSPRQEGAASVEVGDSPGAKVTSEDWCQSFGQASAKEPGQAYADIVNEGSVEVPKALMPGGQKVVEAGKPSERFPVVDDGKSVEDLVKMVKQSTAEGENLAVPTELDDVKTDAAVATVSKGPNGELGAMDGIDEEWEAGARVKEGVEARPVHGGSYDDPLPVSTASHGKGENGSGALPVNGGSPTVPEKSVRDETVEPRGGCCSCFGKRT